jgi:hypothetical protein
MNKPKINGNCGFPLPNPKNVPVVDFVPHENIGKNLEELCIGRSNLKHFDGKIVDSNLKKIGHPNPSNL